MAGIDFNPAQVMMGQPGGVGIPWMGPARQDTSEGGFGKALPTAPPPPRPAVEDIPGTTAPSAFGGLRPESVRATGAGPFDPAYRQNLATYAGGQFARPGGQMSFNPTDPSTFPGQPTGGGNAPVPGMPLGLLDQALSGNPFRWTSPQPQVAASNMGSGVDDAEFWMDKLMRDVNPWGRLGGSNPVGRFGGGPPGRWGSGSDPWGNWGTWNDPSGGWGGWGGGSR